MNNETLKLIARLKIGAARLGHTVDVVRFVADPDYAKSSLLRYADEADEEGVVLALQLIERLGLAGAAAATSAPAPVAEPRVREPSTRAAAPPPPPDRYVGRLR